MSAYEGGQNHLPDIPAERWREMYEEAAAELERLRADLARAEAALRELVELEDMRLRLRQLHEMGHGTDYADYHRLLPLAWAAARAALGPNAQAQAPAEGAQRP